MRTSAPAWTSTGARRAYLSGRGAERPRRATARQRTAPLRREPALRPLLAERIEACSVQILRCHGHAELHVRVEGEKPWLRKRRDLRRVFQIYDHGYATPPVAPSEVDRLWLRCLQNSLQFLPDAAVSNRSVERLMRDLALYAHSDLA